jgi:ACS family glucarate transporter-like MFS transporter
VGHNCRHNLVRNGRGTPERHPLVLESELALIIQELDPINDPSLANDESPDGKRSVPWVKIFDSKEVIALTLSYFSFGYVAWVFFGWFYIYLAQVRGLNPRTSAVYSMLPFVGMTIGCLSGGVAGDWLAQHFNLRLGRCFLPAFSMALTRNASRSRLQSSTSTDSRHSPGSRRRDFICLRKLFLGGQR